MEPVVRLCVHVETPIAHIRLPLNPLFVVLVGGIYSQNNIWVYPQKLEMPFWRLYVFVADQCRHPNNLPLLCAEPVFSRVALVHPCVVVRAVGVLLGIQKVLVPVVELLDLPVLVVSMVGVEVHISDQGY